MVIRHEDSGVSSSKNLGAWRWPPRGSVAVPTRVHVDRFSNFSNEGIFGMADKIPHGSSGAKPL